MKGLFITFEGPEGSGKTTHARRVAERLRAEGYDVVETREPGGTRVGEAIRHLLQHDADGDGLVPKAECLLFAASRAQLVSEVILPALESGACVVCDRFADSTTAYQGFGRGLDVTAILTIRDFAIDGAQPDLTILLDVETPTGQARLEQRRSDHGTGPDRLERESAAFHERVRRGYLEMAAREPGRFRVVRADRPLVETTAEVWGHVAALLAARRAAGAELRRRERGA